MLKKVLVSLVVIFLSNNLYSNTLNSSCDLSHKIIYGIAKNERHPKRDVGYPYLISFNNSDDLERVKNDLVEIGLILLDNRTVDCINKDTCSTVTKYLVQNNIKNLDLGPFQHCYRFYKYKYEDYFDLVKSYKKTCEIISNDVNKYGFSWESIARFHNNKEEFNKPYREKLQDNLLETYPELASN